MNHIASPAAGAKSRLAAFAFLAASAAFTGQAQAISPGSAEAPVSQSLVTKVHGCHRSCEFGYIPRWGISRWHRHAGARCLPVRCAPRAAQPNRCWVDGRGVRHCRW